MAQVDERPERHAIRLLGPPGVVVRPERLREPIQQLGLGRRRNSGRELAFVGLAAEASIVSGEHRRHPCRACASCTVMVRQPASRGPSVTVSLASLSPLSRGLRWKGCHQSGSEAGATLAGNPTICRERSERKGRAKVSYPENPWFCTAQPTARRFVDFPAGRLRDRHLGKQVVAKPSEMRFPTPAGRIAAGPRPTTCPKA